MINNAPHNALRYHVTGAIARGEAEPITERRPDPITQAAEEIGRDKGRADAGWVEIHSGNAAAILQGIEDGDPETMDMMPAPLSGEYAGESIPELIEQSLLDRYDVVGDDRDAWCDAYEAAFSDAYWNEIRRTCRYHIN